MIRAVLHLLAEWRRSRRVRRFRRSLIARPSSLAQMADVDDNYDGRVTPRREER